MKAYAVQSVKVDREARTVWAEGKVALDCEVLKDHFPQFPVLPGVLMLDLMKSISEKWDGKNLRVLSVKRVRFLNYLKPGAQWEARMRAEDLGESESRWSGEILSSGAKMASAVLTLSVKG